MTQLPNFGQVIEAEYAARDKARADSVLNAMLQVPTAMPSQAFSLANNNTYNDKMMELQAEQEYIRELFGDGSTWWSRLGDQTLAAVDQDWGSIALFRLWNKPEFEPDPSFEMTPDLMKTFMDKLPEHFAGDIMKATSLEHAYYIRDRARKVHRNEQMLAELGYGAIPLRILASIADPANVAIAAATLGIGAVAKGVAVTGKSVQMAQEIGRAAKATSRLSRVNSALRYGAIGGAENAVLEGILAYEEPGRDESDVLFAFGAGFVLTGGIGYYRAGKAIQRQLELDAILESNRRRFAGVSSFGENATYVSPGKAGAWGVARESEARVVMADSEMVAPTPEQKAIWYGVSDDPDSTINIVDGRFVDPDLDPAKATVMTPNTEADLTLIAPEQKDPSIEAQILRSFEDRVAPDAARAKYRSNNALVFNNEGDALAAAQQLNQILRAPGDAPMFNSSKRQDWQVRPDLSGDNWVVTRDAVELNAGILSEADSVHYQPSHRNVYDEPIDEAGRVIRGKQESTSGMPAAKVDPDLEAKKVELSDAITKKQAELEDLEATGDDPGAVASLTDEIDNLNAELSGLETQANKAATLGIVRDIATRLEGAASEPNEIPLRPSEGKAVADAYEALKHNPTDPEVKAAYDDFKAQTLAQYNELVASGIRFELAPVLDVAELYPTADILREDVLVNRHMSVNADPGDMPLDHPLMEIVPGTDWTYNQIFRAVHDIFGHVQHGYQFTIDGEEIAWRAHAKMYKGDALRALATETRGQSSWVGYGPFGEANQALVAEGKIGSVTFPPQKAALLPAELSVHNSEPEMVQVTHYSRADKAPEVLDPAKHGTGYADAASARKKLHKESFLDRVYLYMSREPEVAVRTNTVLAGSIDRTRLYDLQADPLNLQARGAAEAASAGFTGGPVVTNFIEGAVARAGFDGYHVNEVAVVFKPVTLADVSASEAAMVRGIANAQEAGGGFTFRPSENWDAPGPDTTGFLVGQFGESVPRRDLTPRMLRQFQAKHAKALNDPNTFVGIWHNPETGQIDIDVTRLVTDEGAAKANALKTGQFAFGKMVNGEYVDTIEIPKAERVAAKARKVLDDGGVPKEQADAAEFIIYQAAKFADENNLPVMGVIQSEMNAIDPTGKLPQFEHVILDPRESIPNIYPGATVFEKAANYIDAYARENPVFTRPLSELTDAEIRDGIIRHTNSEMDAWESTKPAYESFYGDHILNKANPLLQAWARAELGRELIDDEIALFHLFGSMNSGGKDPSFDSRFGYVMLRAYINEGEITAFSKEKFAVEYERKGKNAKPKLDKEGKEIPKLDEHGNLIPARLSPTIQPSHVDRLNLLLKKKGLHEGLQWLRTIHPVSEIIETMELDPKAVDYHENFPEGGEAFGIFGLQVEKQGSYTLNRWQMYGTVTQDMWVARTMARFQGFIRDAKGAVVSKPWGTSKEHVRLRNNLQEAWREVARQRGIEAANVQERMWAIEQSIWKKLGAVDKSFTIEQGIRGGIATYGPASMRGKNPKVKLPQRVGRIIKGLYDAETRTVELVRMKSDISTVIHETGHFLKNTLLEIERYRELILRHYGDAADAKGHERFARHLEQYFHTGEASDTRMAGLFESIRTWMRGIYAKWRYGEAEGEVRQIFNKVFGPADEYLTQLLKRASDDVDASLPKTVDLNDVDFALAKDFDTIPLDIIRPVTTFDGSVEGFSIHSQSIDGVAQSEGITGPVLEPMAGLKPDPLGNGVTLEFSKTTGAPPVMGRLPWLGTRIRIGMAHKIGLNKSPTVRYIGQMLFPDALEKSDGSVQVSAMQWVDWEERQRIGQYDRLYTRAYENWRKATGKPRMGSRNEFAEAVYAYRLNRGKVAGDPRVLEALKMAHQAEARLYREIKTGIWDRYKVPGWNRFEVDDWYLPRLWDKAKVADFVRQHGFEKFEDMIRKAIISDSDDIDPKLAERMSKGMARTIAGFGRQTGPEVSRITNPDTLAAIMDILGQEADNLSPSGFDDIIDTVLYRMQDRDTLRPARGRRRVRLNEQYHDVETGTVLTDLFDRNSERLARHYTRDIVGHAAFRAMADHLGPKLGQKIDTLDDMIRAVHLASLEEGVNIGDPMKIGTTGGILRTGLNAVMGRPMHPHSSLREISQILRDYQILRVAGQIAWAGVAEIGQMTSLRYWKAFIRQAPAVAKLFRKAADGQLEHALLRDLERLTMSAPDVYHRPDLFGDLADFGDPGFVEKLGKVRKTTGRAAKLMMQANGMYALQNALEKTFTATFAQRMLDDAFSGKTPSVRRLRSWGVTPEFWKTVAKDLKAYARPEKHGLTGRTLRGIDIDRWGKEKPDTLMEFMRLINTESRRAILRPDLGGVEHWMTTPGAQIMNQFMGYPIAAWDKMLIHGLHVRDAEAFSVWGATAFWAGLAYVLRVYGESIGMAEADRKEFLAKRINLKSIAAASFSRSSFSSLTPQMIDTVLKWTGNDPLFAYGRTSGAPSGGFVASPSFDMLDQAYNAARGGIGALSPEQSYRQRDFKALRRLLPANNYHGVTQMLNAIESNLPKEE